MIKEKVKKVNRYGKRSGDEKCRVNVYMDLSLFESINAHSKKVGIAKNNIINEAIKYYLYRVSV